MEVVQQSGGKFTAYDYETIVVDNTVKTLTALKIDPLSTQLGRDSGPARLIIVQNEGAAVRYMVTGTNPDNTVSKVGHYLPDGAFLTFANQHGMRNFKFIRDGSVDSKFRVTYYW